MNYSRNIPLLYIYSIFIKRVSMPIIILYFLFNNLSYTQIGILAAVTSIITLSTEIHGGIFADHYGKKTSMMLHSIFVILTMFFYFIGDSFVWFLIASIMYGIAGAFITGTKNAFLYDTLKQIKRTKEFKKFNGKNILYSHIVNALVLLSIPAIYTIHHKLPFLIGIIFALISLITAYFFVEPPLARRSRMSLSVYNNKLCEAFKEIKRDKKLLLAIVMIMITASFVHMSSSFIQPLLLISGLDIIYFGIVYALMRIILGISSSLTHRLERFFSVNSLLVLGMLAICVAFLGFSIGTGIIIILSVLILKFAEGLNRVVLDDEINKSITSSNRTTILSVSSLGAQLMNASLMLVFGAAADIIGVQHIFYYALALFIVCAILSISFFKHNTHIHP